MLLKSAKGFHPVEIMSAPHSASMKLMATTTRLTLYVCSVSVVCGLLVIPPILYDAAPRLLMDRRTNRIPNMLHST